MRILPSTGGTPSPHRLHLTDSAPEICPSNHTISAQTRTTDAQTQPGPYSASTTEVSGSENSTDGYGPGGWVVGGHTGT